MSEYFYVAILLIIGLGAILILSGCKSNPNPNPEPEPEPNKPKWEDYYPDNIYVPLIDLNKKKWIQTDYNSPNWANYINLIEGWNNNLEKPPIPKGEISDRKLYVILFQKKSNGEYLFQWTSDMQVWGKVDYWASPEEFLECTKNENGDCDINGYYRDDCDGFARFHNEYLFVWCFYWCSLFLEIYWKKKVLVQVGDQLIEKWNTYGHAITAYKVNPESNWKCFSNQSWVAQLHGEKNLMKIVYKFVPINNPQFADKYQLIKVVARHPIEGNLLWQLNGKDHNILA